MCIRDRPLTAASTWTWIDHPVSGLLRLTFALFRLGFPSAPHLQCLTSPADVYKRQGPDLPRADQLYPGNLRYSAKRILTSFSLLIPAFSLLKNPLLLSVQLRLFKNAPLPMNSDQRRPTAVCFICFGIFLISSRSFPLTLICIDHCSSLSFGSVFQPRTFSAQDLSTSELLRTLLMDGCF